MSATLDGDILFDEQQLQIKVDSCSRDSAERVMPGLDGVLSIDLGGRSRIVSHSGVLRANGRTQLNTKIAAISACIDGSTRKLVTGEGQQFDNLRMDSFKVSNERASGSGVVVDYEIVYTQLRS
ncbi:MAG: hypothetical protein JSU70_18430 [Phycisphaerales bacterium]|nr:MAG: hypothetical protein JSU70_18430 [Phycisphaerales bacterium]